MPQPRYPWRTGALPTAGGTDGRRGAATGPMSRSGSGSTAGAESGADRRRRDGRPLRRGGRWRGRRLGNGLGRGLDQRRGLGHGRGLDHALSIDHRGGIGKRRDLRDLLRFVTGGRGALQSPPWWRGSCGFCAGCGLGFRPGFRFGFVGSGASCGRPEAASAGGASATGGRGGRGGTTMPAAALAASSRSLGSGGGGPGSAAAPPSARGCAACAARPFRARLAGRTAGLVRGRLYRVREAHDLRTGVTVRLVRIGVVRHRQGSCHRSNVSSGPDRRGSSCRRVARNRVMSRIDNGSRALCAFPGVIATMDQARRSVASVNRQ